jgi:hypothetical protein
VPSRQVIAVSPRTERGRILNADYHDGIIKLDSGETLNFDMPWDAGLLEGDRALITFGSKGEIVSVGIDLSPLGMTEPAATLSLANIGRWFDVLVAERPLTSEQRELFATLIDPRRGWSWSMGKEARKVCDRIQRALAGDTLPISDDDPWAAAARAELAVHPARDTWIGLLALVGDGAKPTKKWQAAARGYVHQLGVPAFVETMRRWFARVAPRPVVRDADHWFSPAMGDANSDALKNLVWACGTVDDPQASEQLAVAVGDLAVRCFTKIPGIGALSSKAGNACIYVLSQLPGLRAVAQLSRLASRVRYKQALALVDKAMAECAKRASVSPIDLEELSLPTFGLDVDGRSRIEIGDGYAAELAVVDDKATLTFLESKKRLKGVPATVTAEYGEQLADLKSTHKELAALVPTVRARLERWMLEPRAWSLADLRTRYLDHPLTARLARRTIFATGKTSVVFFDGFPLDRAGKELELADDAKLSLWHPLGRPAKEVAEWRSFLASLGVTQPFKQVDREVYRIAGEAKARESARFAGRVVRQHQLAALLRERGWTYSLMGAFDGANVPTKHLRVHDLTVELDVDVPEDAETGGSGIYLQVVIGAVRFSRNDRSLKLADVPERCFSEIMRDVDLFVSGAGAKPASKARRASS